METIQTTLFVLQLLVSISLIGFILIQHGKGADAGAAFGSGASSTVFGARGSGNFLTRATTVLAAIFLINSMALGYLATQRVKLNPSLMQQTDSVILQEKAAAPAAPAEDSPALEAQTPAEDADAPPQIPDTATAPAPAESDVPVLPKE